MRIGTDTFKEIAQTLTRNKSRSLLTGFGIFWGLFMLLFLMGGGKGLKQIIAINFEGFATNSTFIGAQQTTKPYKGMKEGRSWDLEIKDVERLKAQIPELDVVTPTFSEWGEEIVFGSNKYLNGIVKGIYADYVYIEQPKLKYGRFLNESDVTHERKVCVIGKRIYETLFPEGGDPCGKYIRAGGIYYQVVGVNVTTSNINVNGSVSESIVTPITLARKIYNRGQTVDLICATGRKGVHMSEIGDKIRAVLGNYHTVDPEDKNAFIILHAEELFTVVDNLFKGVNFLIWLVGLGTILAGAIGVSNIMMVTVKERTTEIGIRRAIGATPTDTLSQILFESITLTLISGMLSIVFSVLMLRALEIITKGQAVFQISFWTAIGAALMLSVVGAVAGMAPAYRAMKIKPVDAMRDE